MADTYLSSVKLGGTEYDIYAKSALSAGWVPASAIEGPIPASSITAVNESAISSVNISAITAVQESAISSVPWSAISALTATSSQSGNTTGFWTPQTTNEFVTQVVKESISNVYKFQGSQNPDQLNQMTGQDNGDVYNITGFGGILNEGSDNEVVVAIGDNVAWVSATDGGWWDKLASTDTSAKLDTTAFTAWSANTASEFSGSAASANTAWVTMNVSGNDSTGGNTASADGYSLIQSALSGASAWETITAWSADGKPISTSGNYLVGDGSKSANLALVEPENSIVTGSTHASALVNAQGISSFVDSNYIAKSDIYVNTATGKEHQLVINNLIMEN